MIDEIWRPVIITKGGVEYDYTGRYEVSTLGRVRSLNSYGHGKTQLLKLAKSNKGYLQVSLYKDGKQRTFLVHRIVAEVYIPNPDGLPVVNHINEDKTCNSVENLEWCTHSENMKHGTCPQRIGEAQKDRPKSEEHKRKLAESRSKKVRCITTGQIFDSISQASDWYQQETGKGRIAGFISECCKGKRKSIGGYTWEYVQEEVL